MKFIKKKNLLLIYYLIIYSLQIFWLSNVAIPLYLNYFLTFLVLLPALINRVYFPSSIALFGITYEFFIRNTFFAVNLVTFVGLILLFYDIVTKYFSINKIILSIGLFLFYCVIIEYYSGASLSFTNVPLYLRSFIWFLIISFYSKSRLSNELVLLSVLISSLILITFHLFFNFGLDASLTTSDGLGDFDFISLKDRNYLSFNFFTAYILALSIFFNFVNISILRFNQLSQIIIIGYILLGIVAFSSRTIVFATVVVTIISVVFNVIKRHDNININSKSKSIKLIIIIFGGLIFAANQGYLNLLLFRIFEENSLRDGSGRTEIVKLFISNFDHLSISQRLLGQGYGAQYKLTNGVDTHNDYLAILASYGFVGLFIWFYLLIKILKFRGSFFSLLVFIGYLITALSISPLMSFGTPIYLATALSYGNYYKFSTKLKRIDY